MDNLFTVANQNTNNISVISTATNTVVGSPIPVGMHPAWIAITPTLLASLKGRQEKNDFATIFELFNHLEWRTMPSPVSLVL